MDKHPEIKEFCNLLIHNSKPNQIVCILLHGAIVFNPEIQATDIDLVVVLRQRHREDMEILRKCKQDANLFKFSTQLHLVYLFELPKNSDFFSMHTCGAFFVWHLREAQVLYGENIFFSLNGPSDYQLQISLMNKIQQYTFVLRSIIFNFSEDRIDDKTIELVRKRTISILKDILMSDGILLQKDEQIVEKTIDRYSIFDENDIKFLLKISRKNGLLKNTNDQLNFLNLCLGIHEKIYAIMRENIAHKTKCRFMV